MRFILSIFLISSFLFAQEFRKSAYQEQEQRNIFNRNQKAGSPFPNMRFFRENEQRVEHFNASNPFIQTQSNDELWEANWVTDDIYAPIYPKAVLMSPDSFLYVITEIEDQETLKNIRIDKTDFAGNIIWTRKYDGPKGGNDYYEYSFVNPAGHLIIITKHYTEFQWTEYDSFGNLINDHPTPFTEYLGSSLRSHLSWKNDEEGNLYLSGKCEGIFIMSLDSSGIIQNWYVDENYNWAEETILKLDKNGNPILSYLDYSWPAYFQSIVQKFSKNLILDWTYSLQTRDNGWGGLTETFATDSESSVIILNNRGQEDDYENWESYLVKLDSAGIFVAEEKLDFINEYYYYYQMVIDDLDNIYILDNNGLQKYDKNLNYIWSNENITDGSIGAIDPEYSLFIGYRSSIIKVDSLGLIEWSTYFDYSYYAKYLFFDNGSGFLLTDNIQYETWDFSCDLNRFTILGEITHLSDLEGDPLERDTQVFKSILSYDQSLYLIGGRGSLNNEPLHLAKVDSLGNFQWEKALMQKGPSRIQCGGLKQISHNRLLVTWIETYWGTIDDEYFLDRFTIVNIYDLHGNLVEKHKTQIDISWGNVDYSKISDQRIHYFLSSDEEYSTDPYVWGRKLNHYSYDFSGRQISKNSMITYRDDLGERVYNIMQYPPVIDAEDNVFILFENYDERYFFIWSIDRYGEAENIFLADCESHTTNQGLIVSNGFNNLYFVHRMGQTTRISLIDYEGKSIRSKEYEMNQFINGIVDPKGNLLLISYDPSNSTDKNYNLYKFDKYCKIVFKMDLEDSYPSLMKMIGDQTLTYIDGWEHTSVLYLIDTDSGNVRSEFYHSDPRNMMYGPIVDIHSNNANDIYMVGNKNNYKMSSLKFSDTGLQIGGEYDQAKVVLNGNYPNPFNGATRIQYTLPTSGQVDIDIYNSIGQRVDQFTGVKQAGANNFHFKNTYLSSGIYFYSIKFDGNVKSGKMVFVK